MSGNGSSGLDGGEEMTRLGKFADELADLFAPLDQAGLRRLTAAQRLEQQEAREAFYQYTTRLWDDAKAAGRDPGNDPHLAILGVMRHLALQLSGPVVEVRLDLKEM